MVPDDSSSLSEQLDARASEYGNLFLLKPAPDNEFPKQGMPAR